MEPNIDEKFIARLAAAKHVAVLTGAGISAESGIMTFRGAGGHWKSLRPEQLASVAGFQQQPQLVWSWYQHRRRTYRDATPNPGHLALAELQHLVPRLTLATQNVDRLHQRAGSTGVLELHGNAVENHCFHCNEPAGEVDPTSDELVTCRHCGGWIRPSVVWFGEMLPVDVLEAASEAAGNCDVYLSIGTSAQVFPAAQLPVRAKHEGAMLIEINPEPTPISHLADYAFQAPAGEVLPAIVARLRQKHP